VITITDSYADYAQSSAVIQAGGTFSAYAGHFRLDNFTGLTAGGAYAMHGGYGGHIGLDAEL
jgi:hypothetical protein